MELNHIFSPSSIAVVGASRKPFKVGNIVFYNLLQTFKGRLYGINKNGGTVYGRKLYRSLSELPEVPDLVVVAVPSEDAVSVMEEADRLGVKGGIILSGGFGEAGRSDLDEGLKGISIPFIGPNCIGVYSPSMNATFIPPERTDLPGSGNTAIISQSGGILVEMLDMFSMLGEGVELAVSLGNKLKVDEVDVLDYVADRDDIRNVVLYLEGVERGRELYNLIDQLRDKRIIIVKGGRTEKGSRQARSHTEAAYNPYKLFKDVLEHAGAIIVDSIREAVFTVHALRQGDISGNNVLVVTNGGGFGVLAADYSEREGFKLPPYEKPVDLPERVITNNPVDLTGDADASLFHRVLSNLSGYDAVFVLLTVQVPNMDPDIIRVVASVDRPVYVYVPGYRYAGYIASMLRRFNVPVFDDLSLMFRVAGNIYRRSLRVR